MNSKNPPAAYRATAARLATMTIAQRAAEINRKYHATFTCEDALRGAGV